VVLVDLMSVVLTSCLLPVYSVEKPIENGMEVDMQRVLVQGFRIALFLLAAISLMGIGAYSSDKVIIEGEASDGESLRLEIVRPIPEAACTALFLYKGNEQVLSVTEYFARSLGELVGAIYFPVLGVYVTVTADLESNEGSEVELLVGRDGGEYGVLPREMVLYDMPFIKQSLYTQLNECDLASEIRGEIDAYVDSLGLGERWNVLGFSFSVFRRLCEYEVNLCEARHLVFSYMDLLAEVSPTLVYNSAPSEFGSLVTCTVIGWWNWIGAFLAGGANIIGHHPEWIPSGGGTKLAIPMGAKEDPLNPRVWDYPDRVIPKHQPWNTIMK